MIVAALLPALLAPAAPFPHVMFDAANITTVAPGIDSATYHLYTDDGPIVIHVVAASRRGDVRFNTVLASDKLTSSGETVSSMARRTGAVAGINADYFDIGNTNRPTNIVVSNDALVRTPRKRYALVISTQGDARFVEENFSGTVQLGTNSANLDAVNEMPPPNGGVSLITPAFGRVSPYDNLTLIAMQPVTTATPPFGSYRVTSIADNTVVQDPGYYLAVGLNSVDATGVPNPGDAVLVNGDLQPASLSDMAAAAGGGPLILQNGAYFDDPDGPRGGEYDVRIPSSGAAIAANGTVYLIEVDGRQPSLSIGLTRPQFASLMRALGANDGIAFDGGGSSELAVRTLGSPQSHLVSSPSDGVERPVADGMFVYSTAPYGAASQLVALPQRIDALPNARVAIATSVLDAADHVVDASGTLQSAVEPATLGTFDGTTFTAGSGGDGALILRRDTLTARVPIHVGDTLAELLIQPRVADVAQGGSLAFHAVAFDALGHLVTLPPQLPWRASGGSISRDGAFRAADSDAVVSLLIGDHLASVHVVVGSHDVPIEIASAARLMTVPSGGDGAVTVNDACAGCVSLRYALGTQERAAYAVFDRELPSGTTHLRFDVRDDGSGARLKVALRNAINEEVLLNATTLTQAGWRSVDVALPPEIAQPVRLVGLYAIAAHPGDTPGGQLAFRNVFAVVAGQR